MAKDFLTNSTRKLLSKEKNNEPNAQHVEEKFRETGLRTKRSILKLKQK